MDKEPAMKLWTKLACASALALAAAGCNRSSDATGENAQAQMALPALPATLPLEAGAPTELAPAPSASDLPDAPPLKLARVADQNQAYGYADAAYSYDEALGDAPPDYGFDYGGTDPWAWQGYDDSLMVAEPIDDGYRYYYYRPGADEPYFVRDPFYSYGFANGLLAVVYGADGGIVPYADYGPRLVYASRYYARGRQLYGASRRAKRRPVIAANWLRQRPVIVASRQRWGAGRAHQPAWQRYHESNRPRQAAYWSAEQVRRQADARRFDGWRQQGFRATPPPRAIPVAWEKAKWAQDDRRYRPAAEARRNDRRQDDRREAREVRQDARQQAQQQARREERQVERQQAQDQRRQAARDERRDQAQADRRDERQDQQRDQRQAERQQAQQQQQREARQQQQQAQRAQQREAQQAQRQAARAHQRQAAQAQQREERQAQQRDARQAQQAERRGAQQAERQQQQAAARQAQQAERRAERQQAQVAERQQRQAEQRQAQQAQRQQAQAAERQQQQAQRQAERQQAQQAQRQQIQQQRQQQRQERRENRGGPGPN